MGVTRVLTLRIPQDKHERLRQVAQRRNISLNRLIDEVTTQLLVEEDAYTRWQVRRARGSRERGLDLLVKLDQLQP
jgi:predicted DNA-binding ribbon-helix-helix protein